VTDLVPYSEALETQVKDFIRTAATSLSFDPKVAVDYVFSA
jgi:hypothetical protein